MNYLFKLVNEQVSNSTFILFRIALGFVIFVECIGGVLLGLVNEHFVEPKYSFTFFGFEFLEFLHGPWMNYYVILMGILGVFFMIGYNYKFTAFLLAFLWTCFLFSHKAPYQNHFYLNMLLLWLYAFLPAHKRLSLDVKKGKVKEEKLMPQGIKWVFMFQVFCFYFYATISKFYPDWLTGWTPGTYFISKKDWWLIGQFFQNKWFHLFIAYAGIVFDGTIVIFLLIPKTRKYAFIASIFFHGTNQILFGLGMLPFLSVSLCLFFFDGVWLEQKIFKNVSHKFDQVQSRTTLKKTAFYLLIGYCVVQLLIPTRHYFYSGDVLYTDEGHRFSWRMKLRSKWGYIRYHIKDEKGELLITVLPRYHFSKRQAQLISSRPEMMRKAAFLLAKEYQDEFPDKKLSIYVTGYFIVNRKPQKYRLVDPELDLLTTEWTSFGHNDWVNVISLNEDPKLY